MSAINIQPNNSPIYPSKAGDRGLSTGVTSSAVNPLTPTEADSFTKQSKPSNPPKTESKPAVAPWVWALGALGVASVAGLSLWTVFKKKETEPLSKVASTATEAVTTAIGEQWDNPHVLAWFNVAKMPKDAYKVPENTLEPESVKQFSETAKRHLAAIQVAPNGTNYKMTLNDTQLSFPWLISNQPATVVDETMKQNFAKLYDYFQADRVAFFKSYGKVAGIEFIDLENTKQPEVFGTFFTFLQPLKVSGRGAERKTALQWLQVDHPNIKKMVMGHGMGTEQDNNWHVHGGRYANQKVFDFIDQQTQAGEEVATMVCQNGLISAGNIAGENTLNLKLIKHGEQRVNKVWNLT